MPTYVVLYRFTEQGRKNIKSTVRRAAQIRRQNEARGFKVIGTWWTEGRYDLVSVIESPTEEAMLQGLFNIAEAGNVTSETLRAHTQQLMERALRRAAAPRRAGRRRAAAPRRAAARRAPARRAAARRAPARRAAARRAPARRRAARR